MNKIGVGPRSKNRRDHHARVKKYVDFVTYPEALSNAVDALHGLQPG